MRIDGRDWRSIWLEESDMSICVIDQTKLPHSFSVASLRSCEDVANAISQMVVRGAPLIGVTGAYGLMLALQDDSSDNNLFRSYDLLLNTRPTAINLRYSLQRVLDKVKRVSVNQRAFLAKEEAKIIANEDISMCEAIGNNGLLLFDEIIKKKKTLRTKSPLNILTHCNAGWLATVDWGTALSPIYKAHRKGMDIHVWVDETRPRNQGASLTAFELANEGISHSLVVDNAGGYLMQTGKVDAVIVGADRMTRFGDICNKIGTYLKALSAKDNNIPFYVALPSSTIDWTVQSPFDIPIEIRSPDEIKIIRGLAKNVNTENNNIGDFLITSEETRAFNPAFDITPSNLVDYIITEKGVVKPSESRIKQTFCK